MKKPPKPPSDNIPLPGSLPMKLTRYWDGWYLHGSVGGGVACGLDHSARLDGRGNSHVTERA